MNNFVIYNTESQTPTSKIFEVSDLEVQECINTKKRLVKALDIEIIYDQIIESYWDYKNKVNYWNLRAISTSIANYILNHEIRSSLNSLVFNLLNLSKMYLDWHFNENKKRCFAFEMTCDENVKQEIISQRNHIYESNLNYVIGCHLRGHSQHSTLPVRTFTTDITYNQGTQNRTANFSIFYGYEELCKIGISKDKISKNIKLDLTDIIDGYVYAVSQKHMLNRKLTESIVKEDRLKYLGMWQSLIDQVDYSNFLCELHTSDKGLINISLAWFDVYDYLKSKHRFPINYSAISFGK